MELAYSEEHEQLRSTVRQFLQDHSDEASVRLWMEDGRGYDEAVWRKMAAELGLQGLIVAEEHGGSDCGPAELAIVLEEMGRALLCAPYFATAVLAVNMLREVAREDAQKALLPSIAAGSSVATVVLAGAGRGGEVHAELRGTSWQLRGDASLVIDGHVADLLLVVAETDRGLALFRVDAAADGLERAALSAFDPTRKIARISLDDVEAEILSTTQDQSDSVDRAIDLCTVALAAEQLGGAQRCLDSAVDYAHTRIQFGRPIGSFQAVKHRCADLLIEVEFARSAVVYAAHCAAGDDPAELRTAASMAKAYCSEAFAHAADANLQIHGGMGYTWEHSAHLYLKRSRSSAVLLGDPAMHRERVADQIGL